MSTAVRVDALSKGYRLGSLEKRPETLAQALFGLIKSPVRNYRTLRDQGRVRADETEGVIWALRDVSFEVRQGDAVGVVGRNGAGKSTLLKILSRITEPTVGFAEVRGRVATLLEVGTGFHDDLTGRENIFLNAAVLGMSRKDTALRLDRIVEFSGLEKFLDTPVKRYSSGMRMRLAFSVAAHLEPDILVLDEVLAVGDAEFQKKCLGRMENVHQEGRTVLFVSHNLPAVTRLCNKGILLEGGKLLATGTSMEIVDRYMSTAEAAAVREWTEEDAPGNADLRLLSVSLCGEDGSPLISVKVSEAFAVRVRFVTNRPSVPHRVLLAFSTQGVCAFECLEPKEVSESSHGPREVVFHIPPHFLAEGEYSVKLAITNLAGTKFVVLRDALVFLVSDPVDGTSARGDYAGELSGVTRPKVEIQRIQGT